MVAGTLCYRPQDDLINERWKSLRQIFRTYFKSSRFWSKFKSSWLVDWSSTEAVVAIVFSFCTVYGTVRTLYELPGYPANNIKNMFLARRLGAKETICPARSGRNPTPKFVDLSMPVWALPSSELPRPLSLWISYSERRAKCATTSSALGGQSRLRPLPTLVIH